MIKPTHTPKEKIVQNNSIRLYIYIYIYICLCVYVCVCTTKNCWEKKTVKKTYPNESEVLSAILIKCSFAAPGGDR